MDSHEKARIERTARMEMAKPYLYERGKDFFGGNKEKAENWKRCVDARITDIYQGSDLEMAMFYMDMIRKGAPMEEIKKLWDNEKDSGNAAFITTLIVRDFSDRGQEFAEMMFPERFAYEKAKLKKLAEQKGVSESTSGQ